MVKESSNGEGVEIPAPSVNIHCCDIYIILYSIFLHSASRRRRRKGNPVPRGIAGSHYSSRIKIRGPGLPGLGNLESETILCG
jgi:hypothetical protein